MGGKSFRNTEEEEEASDEEDEVPCESMDGFVCNVSRKAAKSRDKDEASGEPSAKEGRAAGL